MAIKRVYATRTFEVTLTLTASRHEDEEGADIRGIEVHDIEVDGGSVDLTAEDLFNYMQGKTEKEDWNT